MRFGVHIEGYPVYNVADGFLETGRIMQDDEGVKGIDKRDGEITRNIVIRDVRAGSYTM